MHDQPVAATSSGCTLAGLEAYPASSNPAGRARRALAMAGLLATGLVLGIALVGQPRAQAWVDGPENAGVYDGGGGGDQVAADDQAHESGDQDEAEASDQSSDQEQDAEQAIREMREPTPDQVGAVPETTTDTPAASEPAAPQDQGADGPVPSDQVPGAAVPQLLGLGLPRDEPGLPPPPAGEAPDQTGPPQAQGDGQDTAAAEEAQRRLTLAQLGLDAARERYGQAYGLVERVQLTSSEAIIGAAEADLDQAGAELESAWRETYDAELELNRATTHVVHAIALPPDMAMSGDLGSSTPPADVTTGPIIAPPAAGNPVQAITDVVTRINDVRGMTVTGHDSMQVVYFVPSDLVTPDVPATAFTIGLAAQDAQQVTAAELGGPTFALDPVQIVIGDPSATYGIQPDGTVDFDVLDSTVSELLHGLGFATPGDDSEAAALTMVVVEGAGLVVSGNGIETPEDAKQLAFGEDFGGLEQGGQGYVGKQFAEAVSGRTHYAGFGSPGILNQTAAFLHEGSHVIGCEHPDAYKPAQAPVVGIMTDLSTYPGNNDLFSKRDREVLEASRFIQ